MDKDINFDDIPRLTEEDFANSRPIQKIMVNLRVDREVFLYFKSMATKEVGFQQLMREALKEKMDEGRAT